MEFLRLCAIATVTALLGVLLRQYKSPLAILATLGGGCLLLFLSVPYLRDVVAFAETLAQKTGLPPSYLGMVLKIIAITFMTEYVAALCRDAGESALAAKLEMAGKLIILGTSMPMITSFFETVIAVLP